MVIVCEGPDTFRAQEKARELERAFREKYDAHGTSIERVAQGKEAAKEVITRSGGLSLFATRRFIRTANLFQDLAKKEESPLVHALAQTNETTIVVSVEDEPVSAALEKKISEVTKCIRYPFPLLQGGAFVEFLRTCVAKHGLSVSSKVLEKIATTTDGDTWAAWNELQKAQALGDAYVQVNRKEEAADAFLLAERMVRGDVLSPTDRLTIPLGVQTHVFRQALRCLDGSTAGLSPFFVKKWRNIQESTEIRLRYAHFIRSVVGSRVGLGSEQEMGW